MEVGLKMQWKALLRSYPEVAVVVVAGLVLLLCFEKALMEVEVLIATGLMKTEVEEEVVFSRPTKPVLPPKTGTLDEG